MDPLGANKDRHPAALAARDARLSWVGFLDGITILALSILVSVGIWHFVGKSPAALSADELTEIEALLDQLGFPPGPVDGAIDEQSRDAIRDFQVTAGLTVEGTPSAAPLDELRAAHAELSGN